MLPSTGSAFTFGTPAPVQNQATGNTSFGGFSFGATQAPQAAATASPFSFGLGTQSSAAPAASSLTLGTQSFNPGGSFSFGASPATAQGTAPAFGATASQGFGTTPAPTFGTPTPSFGLGQPQANTAGPFGTQNPVPVSTGFSLGGSSGQPFGTGGTNLFGTAPTASSNPFGTTLVAGSTPFGTLPTTSTPYGAVPTASSTPFGTSPAVGSTLFGTPAAGSTPFGTAVAGSTPFGTAAAGSTPFGTTGVNPTPFGTVPAASSAPFGTASTANLTPFGTVPTGTVAPFGMTPAASAPFGQVSNTSTNQFGFGGSTMTTATTTAAAPFSFGLGPTNAPTVSAGTGFSLGNTTTAPFGITTSAATSGFGLPATSTAQAAGNKFTFGLGGSNATPFATKPFLAPSTVTPTAPSFVLGLGGTPATSVVPTSTGFQFGPSASNPFGTNIFAPSTGTTAAGSSNLGLAMGATPFGMSLVPTTQGQAAPVGLGGISGNTLTDGFSSYSNNRLGRSVKEQNLPPELLVLVDEFKDRMKTEKVKMAEIVRAPHRNVDQVCNSLDETKTSILKLSNIIQRNMRNCKGFRQKLDREMRNAEMAHIIRDTPPALQADNDLPTAYFFELIKDFDNRMVAFAREIKKAEVAVEDLDTNPNIINGSDLSDAMEAVRDSMIFVAAKIKTLHDRVTAEVDTHRHLLRVIHGDGTKDIFTEKGKELLYAWRDKSKDSTSGFFPTRTNDPIKLYKSYLASRSSGEIPGNQSLASQYGNLPPLFHSSGTGNAASTPRLPYYGGSTTLFHSPCSPIFNPHLVTSPPPTGISLKRTKH